MNLDDNVGIESWNFIISGYIDCKNIVMVEGEVDKSFIGY